MVEINGVITLLEGWKGEDGLKDRGHVTAGKIYISLADEIRLKLFTCCQDSRDRLDQGQRLALGPFRHRPSRRSRTSSFARFAKEDLE